MYETIDYAIDDRILTITLNRPERMNAFTPAMYAEVIDAFDRADRDDTVGAVIVTGAGRAFSAGADLGGGAETFDFAKRRARSGETIEGGGLVERDKGGLVTLRIFASLKPVIGAINGVAVGVGATMTLPMDIRLAATGARFGFPFARRGIVPEAASSWFLPRVVGISRALEWNMTGRIFGVDEALEAGLVRSILPPDELLPKARAIAREIVDNNAPVSVALARQMMWQGLVQAHPMEAHRVDSALVHARGVSADAAEGVTSFVEKRPPHYPCTVSADLPADFPWWVEPTFTA